MLPWRECGRADIPGESAPLVLRQRGHEFVIRVGGVALMSSEAHGSEEALAETACRAIADRVRPAVLVGGLGMGFTLAAALRELPAEARVVVAELIPAVVEWNRGVLADLAGRPLEDARVEVHVGDVAEAMRGSSQASSGGHCAFDAILLDVDNGPDGLTRPGNGGLYSDAGLQVARGALTRGGVLGVWSVAADPGFTRRLQDAGFRVEEREVRARRTKGGRHTLWLGVKR